MCEISFQQAESDHVYAELEGKRKIFQLQLFGMLSGQQCLLVHITTIT